MSKKKTAQEKLLQYMEKHDIELRVAYPQTAIANDGTLRFAAPIVTAYYKDEIKEKDQPKEELNLDGSSK